MTNGTEMTLSEYVRASLSEHGNAHFLRELGSGRSITYGDALSECERVGDMLASWQVGPGDRVALLGSNSINWCLVYLSCVMRGIVIVPVLSNFSSMNVHNILSMSEASVVFVSPECMDRIEGAKIKSLRRVANLETLQPVRGEAGEHEGGNISRFIRRAASRIGKRDAEEPAPKDLAAIIYTSGTTGQSKGVMLTQENIVTNVRAVHHFCDISPEDRFLSILPLSHTFECTVGFLAPMAGGASIHQVDGKPTPRVLQRAFAQVHPTVILSVPLIMEKIYFKRIKPKIEGSLILKAASRIPGISRMVMKGIARKLIETFGGSLRLMALGGAPLNPEVELFLSRGGFPYVIGYGMTECSPLITASMPSNARLSSCGHAVEGVTIRVADPDPDTGVGEIQVRGPNVTTGYFKNPDATDALFTEDGWLRTGDLGIIDRDWFLFIKGRSKNMILGPSGENIYPEEIEQLINRSPSVIESLVVSRDGKLVALIVPDTDVLRDALKLHGLDDHQISRKIRAHFDGLMAGVNRNLPDFSRVNGFELKDREFDKTPTEKIKRYLYC